MALRHVRDLRRAPPLTARLLAPLLRLLAPASSTNSTLKLVTLVDLLLRGVPPPAVPVQSEVPSLTAAAHANASPMEQKQMLGEVIYMKIAP